MAFLNVVAAALLALWGLANVAWSFDRRMSNWLRLLLAVDAILLFMSAVAVCYW
ncbi:MAG: hypothetical protein KY476_09290 [Planctomycetes bacterium]|nr:hypothetical protein [Planctomycetota bacterium]